MNEIKRHLRELFVFQDIGEKDLEQILESLTYSIKEYNRSERIYTHDDFELGVCFIIEGSCEVFSTHDTKSVILNRLSKYDSFGALTLFSNCDEYPTEVRAEKKTQILFISKSEMLKLIEKYPIVAVNLLKFLTERIKFLNSRIDNMTRGGINARLAAHICGVANVKQTNEFKLNMKKCSEILGVGRASVYRALNALITDGCIAVSSGTVLIIDKTKLEEYLK